MLDEIIQKSRSADPEQRRQAISALANSRDQAALVPLATIYRTDPDPTLRELALKAGRYLRQHASAVPTAVSVSADGTVAGTVANVEGKITARDQELAKGYLDTATSHMTQGDKTRAIENLGKALALNPALAKESFVYNVIMSLTGMRPDEALPILTHPDRRGDLIVKMGGKQRTKRMAEHIKNPEKMTWDNVFADFGIYFLVTTLSLWIVLIASVSLVQDMLDSMPMMMPTSDLETLLTASVIALGITSVFVGISSVVSLAIQGAAIHAAATYILGGDGTLVYLFRRLVPFESVVTLIFSASFVVLSLFGSSAEVWVLISLGSVVGTIAMGYYLAKLVGEVYNFGAGSGCGAIVMGSVLVAALSWFGNYLMVGLLSKLL